MTKRALIVGISGQDGSLLADLLLGKGYEVVGTSRDAGGNEFSSLCRLSIRSNVETLTMNPQDLQSVLRTVRQSRPDEIYNVGSQSSVALSFDNPFETLQSNILGALHLMEAMRNAGHEIRMYNAGSSECFGEMRGVPANENTPFKPLSPYAVAKAAAHWQVRSYRDSYGLFIANGIAFNHESPLRPEYFVTRKITSAAVRIANGSGEKLTLGNLSIRRDWGWAPEYVDAMWRMLQCETADDFVIATGESNSLQDFVAEAFGYCGLDWRDKVEIDETLFRPSEISANCGDASKAAVQLSWRPTVGMKEVVRKMIESERGNDVFE